MSSNHPEVLLRAEFHDMRQYGDSVGWDLDFRQLDEGILDAHVKAISMEQGILLEVDFNRGFHQVGCPPEDQLTFGIPSLKVDEFNWCLTRARGGSLLNFNLEGGFEAVSPAGFCGHTLSFHTPALQAFTDALGVREDLGSLVTHDSLWHSSAIVSLNHKLQNLTGNLGIEGTQALKENAELLNEEIALTLIGSLLSDTTLRRMSTVTNRQSVLKRSLDLLDEVDNLPITVGQLCKRAHTSISTLKRAFLEEFGISAKAYIRFRCLSAVRDELASSHPDTRIVDVANRWGFWHMGQFAADYRRLIGELPNETLRRIC